MDRTEQIEQARRLIATGISRELVAVLHQQFPELKESEDERIRKELWEYFHNLQLSSDCDFSPSLTIDDILAWLERQKEQKSTGWCKEDETFVKDAIEAVENYYSKGCGQEELVSWLKSLRLQPKKEWSMKDENAFMYLHELISFGFSEKFFDAQTAADMREWLNARLKSLRPQPCWKPSEERMEVNLEKEIARFALNGGTGDNTPTIGEVARHFYELGLNARKEEKK